MEQLNEETAQYEAQLAQIQVAISASPDGPDKENLLLLEADIKELISLTKLSLKQSSQTTAPSEDDPFSAEYDLFKAELAELEDQNEKQEETKFSEEIVESTLENLKTDLKELEGMKCQAPYKYVWADDVTYHNALVFHVENLENMSQNNGIRLRVMFTNPTDNKMLPCPFYLEGNCKFNDERCKFSHGELVLLNSLKEYRDPDFSILSTGSRILVKQDDNLWHGAVVLIIDGVSCRVKLESNSKVIDTVMQNTLPLGASSTVEDDSLSSSSSEEESGPRDDEDETVRRILCAPPSSALGEWEQYTRGFASRIMQKMGYIHGAGLGIRGNGRVEPVPAVILPAGKSLDHCMMLRENAGGDADLFKAERKMKRMQKKHDDALSRAYDREKKKVDVFTFLNNRIGQSFHANPTQSSSNLEKSIIGESSRNLSVTSLKLSEEVRKAEKEIKSLNNSLSRHSSQSKAFSVLKDKLSEQERKLSQLQDSEKRISNEQEQRKNRKKLSVF